MNLPGFALSMLALTVKRRVAGLRPRTAPYSFIAPQKSKQKRVPELLARHKPGGFPSLQCFKARSQNSPAAQTFLAKVALKPFRFGCVARGWANLIWIFPCVSAGVELLIREVCREVERSELERPRMDCGTQVSA